MNRTEAVIQLDVAIERIEAVGAMLSRMGCTYNMMNRLQTEVARLEDLRVDIMQADLLEETDD